MLAYLCHPFYLLRSKEGEIEGEKASIRQSKVLLLSMLAYIHKQAFLLSTFGA
jgi:hypothetical protein